MMKQHVRTLYFEVSSEIIAQLCVVHADKYVLCTKVLGSQQLA